MYNDLFKLKLLETRSVYTFNAGSIHVNKYSFVIFYLRIKSVVYSWKNFARTK